jgi:hypothetical protein
MEFKEMLDVRRLAAGFMLQVPSGGISNHQTS